MGPDELPPYVSSDGEGRPAYVAWVDPEMLSAVLRQLLRPRAMIWTWPGSL